MRMQISSWPVSVSPHAYVRYASLKSVADTAHFTFQSKQFSQHEQIHMSSNAAQKRKHQFVKRENQAAPASDLWRLFIETTFRFNYVAPKKITRVPFKVKHLHTLMSSSLSIIGDRARERPAGFYYFQSWLISRHSTWHFTLRLSLIVWLQHYDTKTSQYTRCFPNFDDASHFSSPLRYHGMALTSFEIVSFPLRTKPSAGGTKNKLFFVSTMCLFFVFISDLIRCSHKFNYTSKVGYSFRFIMFDG